MMPSTRRVQAHSLIALGLFALCWPVCASADGVSVQSVEPMTLDTVASGEGDTLFRVAASSGFVTRVSGTGQRLGNGSARALVTIACGSDSECGSEAVRVSVASLGSSSGRIGGLGEFTISPVTASIIGDATGGDPTSFTIAPIGVNSTATFYLGGDITIAGEAGGGATGAASTTLQVTAGFESSSSSDTIAGSALATVLRPVAVEATSPLAFGTIVRPTEGSGAVAIDASTGSRSFSGLGVQLLGAGSSNARFAISGEGGQTVSVTVPDELTLTSGDNSLDVALSASLSSTMLSGALGGAGETELGVGGIVNIDSMTPTGNYSGTFIITVEYN